MEYGKASFSLATLVETVIDDLYFYSKRSKINSNAQKVGAYLCK